MTAAPGLATPGVWAVVGRRAGLVGVELLDDDGGALERMTLPDEALSRWVSETEREVAPRWVWSDTAHWYPALLADGVRVGRCHDLRLCHAILREAIGSAAGEALRAAAEWDAANTPEVQGAPTLFELDDGTRRAGVPDGLDAALGELARQRAAVAEAAETPRMRLLLAAESVGALIAVELSSAGLPWDAEVHDAILTALLGRRPATGGRPEILEETARRVRDALGDPGASLDSPPKLLRSLHRAGIPVETTSRWALLEHDHPAIAPLLEYKRLARLLAANGWHWLDEWVHDGRFRPIYVPAGVVTGRWASAGGGALQLPRQLRAVVRADPGWKLVVADVAQLEPRVLAGMSGDEALASAARGADLYEGIVASGAVATRDDAKLALLGAIYGSTTGESGRLVPRLRRAYPRAMALVDEAARAGERGEVVSTWLGRAAPHPSPAWTAAQRAASESGATAAAETRARRASADRGRFTRNFIVQGTAAEWALVWLGELRARLDTHPVVAGPRAKRSGPRFADRAHLAFFLHDEVIVHAPDTMAEAVAQHTREAADAAAQRLFGAFPIDFPLDVRIADSAAKA